MQILVQHVVRAFCTAHQISLIYPYISSISHFYGSIGRQRQKVKASLTHLCQEMPSHARAGLTVMCCATDMEQGLLWLQKDCPGRLHAHPSGCPEGDGRALLHTWPLALWHTLNWALRINKCKHSWLLWLPEKVNQG